MFLNYDKQKHEISLENRYELIAENFLSSFQNQPTKESLIAIFKKFKVKPVEEREKKLEIITNAQELTIAQNYVGTYRVYKYDDIYLDKDMDKKDLEKYMIQEQIANLGFW